MENYDVRYVFSVKELACQEENSPLWQQVFSKLDKQRIEKVKAIKVPGKRAASAGAGLLLQYWLKKWADHNYMEEQLTNMDGKSINPFKLQLLTLKEVLAGIDLPRETPVKYSKNGKPYPDSACFFFNLSHSEDLVVGAFSDRVVGIDIQYQKEMHYEKVLERFFTKEEQAVADELSREWFYRLWTRKEAFGKLTGEGIAPVINKDFHDINAPWLSDYEFEEYRFDENEKEYDFLKGYLVTCCARKR